MPPQSPYMPPWPAWIEALGRPARLFWGLTGLLLALLVVLTVLLAKNVGTASPAVNAAGLQRMHLQQMAKEALAVAIERRHAADGGPSHTAQLERAREQLDRAMERFQESHERLLGERRGKTVTDPRARQLLGRLDEHWAAYRTELEALLATEGERTTEVEALVARSREIWRLMDRVVDRLEAVDRARSRRERILVLSLSGAVLALLPVLVGLGATQVRLARFEPLTGLPNRTDFRRRLGRALGRARRRSGRLAVLLVDLDRFRDINDSLGFETGDVILQDLAERLRQALPAGAHLGSNGGGDQFAVLLEGLATPTEAEALAHSLLLALDRPLAEARAGLRISTSMGIAHFPDNGHHPQDLLRRAEAALDRAKTDGGHRYRSFDPAMVARASERLFLTTELRRALETDGLAVHYQPVMDLAEERITGLEALVRWPHPDRGWIPPAEFLPLAEETGLITEVDRWVRRHALAQVRSWLDAGRDPGRLAVNVDVRELRDPGFAQRVADELAEAGVLPAVLELEVTEAAFLEEESTQETVLRDLRQLGISVAIDDFGTGYSSLAYLRRLPADRLKVDRAFIRALPDDPHNQTLVMTIMALAEGFGLELLAEGVEMREEADYLATLGCREVQGFYFAHPAPAEEVGEALPERV